MKPNKFNGKFKELESIIKKYNNFLLIIHPGPDADALGSSFSLQKYIESLPDNKKVEIYSIDEPSSNLNKLFPKKLLTTSLNLQNKDVIIILDRGDVYFKLGINKKISSLKNPPKKIINIDHHRKTRIAGALNIRTITASSTSEIIFRFLEYTQFAINSSIAQFLLNGIWFDTGGFKHNSTSPEILEIAGTLMRNGASIYKINKILSSNKSLAVLKLWGVAINRTHINKKTGMAVSYITKEDLKKYKVSIKDVDPAKLSELLNTVSETKFSLVLTERDDNKIKASLRSEEYKKVDVSKIAQSFKGGGHKLASGFEIEGRLEQTKDGWVIK